MTVEFRLLGPLEVCERDEVLPLGAPRVRQVLAALVMDVGRVVSIDRLIDVLWPDEPPARARATVQVYISQLRAVLARGRDAAVTTVGGGYRLDVEPMQIDLYLFRCRVRAARTTADPVRRAQLLRDALGLWRGRPLADATDQDARERLCAGLVSEWLDASEARMDAELAAGRHAEIVTELAGLVRRHPLRERFTGQLMTALYRCGRKADALAAYQSLRSTVVRDLGVEPGVDIRDLHRAVLADALPTASAARLPPANPAVPAHRDRLVGRAPELALLAEELTAAGLGTRFVEVVGEPGIGKTAIVEHVAALADGLGVPFAPLVAAFTDARVLAVAEGTRALLDGLLRAVAADAEQTALAGERFRLHRELTLLLGRLGAVYGRAVVVLDDLHWADAGTVEVLRHLLRHATELRLLVIFAYRPRQASLRLQAAASVTGRCTRIELAPLTRTQANQVLPERLSVAQRDELYRRAGGNPFYLDALSRSVPSAIVAERSPDNSRSDADGDADHADGDGADGMPWPLRAVVLAEWDGLSESARLIAQAAAVLDDPIEPDLLGATADLDPATVPAAVEELVAADVIRPIGTSGRFRHRHPLLREVQYRALTSTWRRAAHQRAAAALTDRNAPAVARAHHVAHVARRGDEHAVRVLLDAARSARPRSPATAAHWFQRALALVPDTERRRQRDVQFALANALGLSGRLAAGRDIAHGVLADLPTAATDRRAELVRFCALMDQCLGRHAEATALLSKELLALPDGSLAAATVKLALGTGSILSDRPTRQGAWELASAAGAHVRHAARIAVRLGAPAVQAQALAVQAMIAAGRDDPIDLARHLDQACALVDGMSDRELARHLDGVVWVGLAESHLERYHVADRHLRRGLAVARTTGQNHLLTHLLLEAGATRRSLGDLAGARLLLADSVDSAVMFGCDEAKALALSYRSRVDNALGAIGAATSAALEAVRIVGHAETWHGQHASASLAEVRLADGDPVACIEQLVRAGGGPELATVPTLFRVDMQQSLVRAALTLDRTADAARWAENAQRDAAALALPGRVAKAELANALVRAHHGDHREAAAGARRAADGFTQVHSTLRAREAHRIAARAWRRAGDLARAADHDRLVQHCDSLLTGPA